MGFRSSGIGLAAVALWIAPACAQTLESVVVSASRAEQRSFDAPAAIEAVDRETLQSSGPQVNLSESLNRVPGLTILTAVLSINLMGDGLRDALDPKLRRTA